MSDWFHGMKRSFYLRRSGFAAVSFFLCLVSAGAVFLLMPSAAADEHSSGPLVLELSLDGEVEPILATYIDEGLADAAKRRAALVLITMDTPGGLSDSMKDMIQHILVSPVPVAVYVSPSGARGASAGFYILLSADIAAMAPGTHAGAASPIIAIGGFPQQIDEVFRKKINQDAMAFLRSFTERRKRNPELAEKAITESKAFTEKEALDAKMIDLIVSSPEDLLRQLDGRTITRFDGTQVALTLKSPVRAPFELSARQKFLARIVEPDVFFCSADSWCPWPVHRIHASWRYRPRSDRRHLPDSRTVRLAFSSGESCGPVPDCASTGVFHP
jgi:membrane-bound serine protease (ClpP class)